MSTRVRADPLRLLQTFDQLHVLRDVALGVREAIENLVLELAHLDLEARLLLHEHFGHLAQIRSLFAQHEDVELIRQPRLCDREINQSGLGLDLGRVVRVRQLRVQI